MKLQIEKPAYKRNKAEEDLFAQIRAEVNAFVKAAPLPTMQLAVKFSLYFGLFAGLYVCVYLISSLPALVALYVGMGLLLVLLGFNFAHDFAHNAVFKSHKANNFCFEALFMLMGTNGYLWKKRHVHSHHNYPNTEGYDVDIELSGIIHLSENKRPRYYHRWQYLYAPVLYLSYSLYWVFYKDFTLFYKRRHANLSFIKHDRKEWAKLWTFKVLYIAYMLVIPILFSHFSWGNILIAFIVMHLLQSWFLLFTLLISHHVESIAYYTPGDNKELATTWFMQQVTTSNDVHPFSKTANFIFGGFNCHVAHHLFPTVSHVHYPYISKIIYKNLHSHHIATHTTSLGRHYISPAAAKKIG